MHMYGGGGVKGDGGGVMSFPGSSTCSTSKQTLFYCTIGKFWKKIIKLLSARCKWKVGGESKLVHHSEYIFAQIQIKCADSLLIILF